MNILVPIDFSDVEGVLIKEAVFIAEKTKAKIILIHVVEPEPEFVGYETGPQTVRNDVACEFHEKHKMLQNEAKHFKQAGIEVTPLLIQGPTSDVILKEAHKFNADMIIIGSHGHGALLHLIMGSVSQDIVKYAKCPVLVVKTLPK